MTTPLRLSLAALLLLGLVCSDDTDTPPGKDKGIDMAADVGALADKAVGEGTVGDAASEGAVGDAATDAAGDLTPDLTPDTGPVTNTYWDEVKYGLPGSLNKIMGANSTLIFAVGQQGLIMKSDGTTWSTMTNPDTNKSNLNALWINPTASYWYAIGDGVILYYLNSQWYKGYSSTYSMYSYTDMWGAADPTLYSIGDAGMIYRKTSSSPSSNFSYLTYSGIGSQKDFKAIWGAAADYMWVVGKDGTIYQCKSSCSTVSSWTTMTSGTTMHLMDVFGFSKTDVWAVGFNGTVLHYDGTSWKAHNLGTKTYFNAVWGTSSKNLFVVGHPYFKNDESAYHYDGTKWTKISPPRVSYINDIWGDSSGKTIHAVGRYNILKYKTASP